MPRYFDSLPSTIDTAAVITAVREIIREVHKHGDKTYVDISNLAYEHVHERVNPAAIKVFLTRETTRANKNNRPLAVLYDYIRSSFQEFPDTARQMVLLHWNILFPQNDVDRSEVLFQSETEYSLGVLLKQWLSISDQEIHRLSAKLFGDYRGDYIMLRKSVHDGDSLIKSKLTIDRENARNGLPKMRHVHHDRHGIERLATGFCIALYTNIYGILKVEDGAGIEMLALRNPIQTHFQKMLGFIISMNWDRNLLSARVFIERDSKLWHDIPPRFKKQDIEGNEQIIERLKLLDEKAAQQIPAQRLDQLE